MAQATHPGAAQDKRNFPAFEKLHSFVTELLSNTHPLKSFFHAKCRKGACSCTVEFIYR